VYGSTMLLTIGQALDRAKDDNLTVRLHIGGDWITGKVVSSDGHGVAVLEPNGDMCVVRQDTVSCVRLPARVNEPYVPTQHTSSFDQPMAIEH
jgi:hypothetical protein